MAHDPQVFVNPNPVPVIWQQYLPQATIFNAPKEALLKTSNNKGAEHEQKEEEDKPKAVAPQKPKIGTDTYAQVVKRLNPTAVIRPPKELVVPEILEQVAVQVQVAIAAAGLQVKELRSIQYGKKIAAARGFMWAEVNVFYGKKGFSIVRSPKTGTDKTLSEELEQLIWRTLQQPCEVDYGINPDADHMQTL